MSKPREQICEHGKNFICSLCHPEIPPSSTMGFAPSAAPVVKITQGRLEEIERDPRGASIFKEEARLLTDAYRKSVEASVAAPVVTGIDPIAIKTLQRWSPMAEGSRFSGAQVWMAKNATGKYVELSAVLGLASYPCSVEALKVRS